MAKAKKTDATTTETFTIATRNGASVDVDHTRVPDSVKDAIFDMGLSQIIRDSASSALAIAYTVAHDGDDDLARSELAGDVDSRKAWAESNGPAIAQEAQALMQRKLDAIYAGQLVFARASAAPKFTELELAMYDAALKLKGRPGCEHVDAALESAKGQTTDERRAIVLDAVKTGNDDVHAWVVKTAEAQLAAFDNFPSI